MTPTFGEAWERLFTPAVAHRGLWSPDGPPENSLAAFQAACAAGYGVELDVQRTADGEAVVFHDSTLERMTGASGRVSDHTAADIADLRLKGSDEPIPTLADVLTLVGHRALVFIEIKTSFGDVGPLERRVCEVLIDHHGPTCVIGFNPYSHAWFAEHHPRILRGLNSHAYHAADSRHLSPEIRRKYAQLEHVSLARPHFLALSHDIAAHEAARKLRKGGLPVVAWTLRSAEQWQAVRADCDNLIFEGFAP